MNAGAFCFSQEQLSPVALEENCEGVHEERSLRRRFARVACCADGAGRRGDQNRFRGNTDRRQLHVDQAMEFLEKQSLNPTSKRRIRYDANKHADQLAFFEAASQRRVLS